MSTKVSATLLLLAAAAGLAFASVSTFDFVQHLDRQVHDLHCSFVPGLVENDDKSTGCQVTLLSPYSSVMRTAMWGGVPISLAAMSIFALLAYRAVELMGRKAPERRTATAILLVLVCIPVVASVFMGIIAVRELDALCKLCIGIYVSSGIAWLAALIGLRAGRQETAMADEVEAAAGATGGDEAEVLAPATPPFRAGAAWLAAAGQLFAFTAIPVVSYAMLVPDHARFIGECGGLIHPEDPQAITVPLGGTGDVQMIEVFDPLCPACKGLEERLDASGLNVRLTRRAVMFPLDSECNWMVDRSLHPGACRVSKAVLCAVTTEGVSVDAVIDWAFQEQAQLLEAGARNPNEVTQRVVARFSALEPCLGSPEVESTLNKSLRWIVANQLTVLTPQVFIDGVKLCDEDTDLGLDFMLQRMLELHDTGALAGKAPKASDAEPGLVPGSEAPPAREPKKKAASKKRAQPTAEPAEPSAAPSGGLPDVDELPPPAVATEEEQP